MRKKRVAIKNKTCTCIYCGKEFLSSKINTKYDTNTCKALYFQEKKTFKFAMEQAAVQSLKQVASQYAKSLIQVIDNRIKSKDKLDVKDLDEMTILFKKGSEFLKENFVSMDLFDSYLKEKNAQKQLEQQVKIKTIKKINKTKK